MRVKKVWNFVFFTCAFVLLYLALYFFVSLVSVTTMEAAPSWVNDSAITKVNVSNFVPKVVGVIVDDNKTSPPDEIDLISGTTRKVWCNATVVDYNGKDDIIACNATLYHQLNKSTQQNDKNEHYSNNSCTTTKTGTYNKTYSCSFTIWYYANNGTWYCNISAWDNGTANLNGQSAHNSSLDSTKIHPLYSLNVPGVIDYGPLALNQNSSSDVIENVTNTGNMNLDLKLYGYGGTVRTENNLSMKCRMGNITIANERFSLSAGTAHPSMTPLSGQFGNPSSVNFNLAQRNSETTNSTKNTYWKIHIPQYNVKGQCNGTIVFNAVVDS
jgi:hypothetical protein